MGDGVLFVWLGGAVIAFVGAVWIISWVFGLTFGDADRVPLSFWGLWSLMIFWWTSVLIFLAGF